MRRRLVGRSLVFAVVLWATMLSPFATFTGGSGMSKEPSGEPGVAQAAESDEGIVAGDPSEPLFGDEPGDVEKVTSAPLVGVPLALPDGRVIMWDVAGEQGSQYARAVFSLDNARTWGDPQRLFDFPKDKGQFTNGAALVSRAGTVHIFGLDYYGFDFAARKKSKSYLWHCRSRDGGKTWDPVQKVDFGLEYTGSSNNAFQLKSGRIIAPVSGLSERKIGPWVSLAPYSDDDGATWQAPAQQITMNTGAADWYESGAAEPVGVELKDGRVWLLPRSQDGYQWETFSRDGGLTWTRVRHTRFVSNQSAMAVMRLADGRLILFWNNCGAEGQGDIHWGYAERAAMAAAVSSDEGKSWQGYREVGRVTGPAQVSYPYITQMQDGYILLYAAGYLARIRPDFLANARFVEDFAAGVRRWSTLAAAGISAVPDPDGAGGTVLKLVKPEADKPAAACMNFPFGSSGELAMSVRIEPGFQGAHLTLSDHYDLPGLPRDGTFPFRMTAKGRVQIVGSGGTWLDTPGDLAPGKWHRLRVKWDCKRGRAKMWLDGTEIAVMEQFVRTLGLCYLRLRSLAESPDPGGLYLRSVEVSVRP